MLVDGGPRAYFLAVPAGTPTGIVVCLHGRGTWPAWQAWLSGMDRLARDEGAVVVFPQGSVQIDRRGFTWDQEADLPYLLAVIDAVRGEFASPDPRVGVCGISAGAWMASFFAAARADDVAALAAVAGLRRPQVNPVRPVPVLAFHGLRDRALPYAGGRGARWKEAIVRRQNRRGRITSSMGGCGGWDQSVPDAARAWAVANGVEGAREDRRVSPTLSRTTYGEGTPAEVTLWTFANAGHTWPGHPGGPVLRLVVGRTGRELDATQEIWRFLMRQPSGGGERRGGS